MKDIYKKMYEVNRNLELRNNPRIEIMLSMINDLNFKNADMLDIGCYDGTFLSKVKNRNNNFHGVEASDFGVQLCEEKKIKVKQFFFDDRNQFPFEDNLFDVIVIGEIIEHIYDTDFFLQEIKRLLKPSGKLIISTPNIASFGRRIFLFLGKNPIIEVSPNEYDSSGHIRYFTFNTLRKLLNKHEFKTLIEKSDVVNFSNSGNLQFSVFAKLFPRLGQSIIFLCEKKA
ncbi:MAG: Two-component response regulator [Parcubacteria group bacterium GW2011_GWD2_38_11]|nr:MAG: Two-component response regulator [Parcubacteria group bacterium GW2011_GWD2_38_11]